MSRLFTRVLARASFAGLMLVLFSGMAAAQYKLTNLVSNQKGVAVHTDPLLVNAWGLAYGPGGPFWISDNGSGWSTLYTAAGVEEGLKVQIPTAGGDGPGSPTGIVFNGSGVEISRCRDGLRSSCSPRWTALSVAGLRSRTPMTPIVAVTTPGAVYTGLAITSKAPGNFLFAADNANNKVDVFDGTFKLVNSFTDTTLPAGFAPFGIQDFGGLLYVSFASSSGASGGYIDIYSEGGILLKRLAQGGPLNQPWGFAIAPKNFGPLSNTLLVSNNTNSGTINAFNSVTGQFVGTIRDTTGKNIVINQLWGIEFGGGSPKDGFTNELFFTAGPDNNLAGTFGKIVFE